MCSHNFEGCSNYDLILELERRNIISDSNSKTVVLEKLKDDNNLNISVVLGFGLPNNIQQCRECRRDLESNNFHYYQSRVGKDGYMMRSNALCHECSLILNEERQKAFNNSEIPDKPENGSICPSCQREWSGNWHRHHEGEKFVEWLCTHCNTHLSDQRKIFIK